MTLRCQLDNLKSQILTKDCLVVVERKEEILAVSLQFYATLRIELSNSLTATVAIPELISDMA